jgi:hypothetical protein
MKSFYFFSLSILPFAMQGMANLPRKMAKKMQPAITSASQQTIPIIHSMSFNECGVDQHFYQINGVTVSRSSYSPFGTAVPAQFHVSIENRRIAIDGKKAEELYFQLELMKKNIDALKASTQELEKKKEKMSRL